jgi:quinol monooxygenase YgiN
MYVRITRFKPIEHWRDEIVKELDSYMEWLKIQPGFSCGLRLFPLHHPDEVARLAVWEDRSYADHAATTEHALAVRSDMLGMTVVQAIHEEEFDEQPLYGESQEADESGPGANV